MIFSSLIFLVVFLGLFLTIYHLLPDNKNAKNIFIILSSIFFYSWGSPKFIFVLLPVTLIDFFLVGRMYHHRGNKKLKNLLFLSSISLNLGLLLYFKYFNFFIDNFNALSGLLGGNAMYVTKVLLPIGISFYTFECITYATDIYRGLHKPAKNVWDYQLYILFFPKLIAGPIVSYHQIADQLDGHVKNEHVNDKLHGFIRFCIGLGKKVLIANVIGSQADAIFSMNPSELNTTATWIGAIAYTFQIYFDFSGYSDMAIGIGKMLGFNLPENFNNPYTSTNITDFWRRWHMTLGQWMMNYLYIPLGGSKGSAKRTYINLAIVFLASGLWHGASWNFVLWGAFHGIFLILDRLFLLNLLNKVGRIAGIFVTFFITVTGWVIFRIEDFAQLRSYLVRMFAFDFGKERSIVVQPEFYYVLSLAVFFSFFTLLPRAKIIHDRVFYTNLTKAQVIGFSVTAVVLYFVCITYTTGASFNPFIYFRF